MIDIARSTVGEEVAVAALPSRRALLAVSAAGLPLLITGCKGVQSLSSPPPSPRDVRMLRAAIAAERIMVARYLAALRQFGAAADQQAESPASVATALAAVGSQHAEHLSQLTARLVEPSADASRPAPAAGPAVPALPAGLAAALIVLEDAEQAASQRLIGQLDAVPPALAQLLASIAASEATHVPFLRAARSAR